jgi:uncharacterized phage-like protein YoqJ
MSTLAFTGHRPPRLGGYHPTAAARVKAFARAQVNKLQPEKIISGMALGWDLAVAQAAIDLGIPFIAAVPFPEHGNFWPMAARRDYDRIRSKASHIEMCSENSNGYAHKLQMRNQWMADHCDVLVALWDGGPGGTANCVRYASLNKVAVQNVWHEWQAWHDTDVAA